VVLGIAYLVHGPSNYTLKQVMEAIACSILLVPSTLVQPGVKCEGAVKVISESLRLTALLASCMLLRGLRPTWAEAGGVVCAFMGASLANLCTKKTTETVSEDDDKFRRVRGGQR